MERADYQTHVNVIYENLPHYLIEYYDDRIISNDEVLEKIFNEMKDWYVRNRAGLDTSNIKYLIQFVLEINLSMNADITQAYERYIEMRRSQKKYWFKEIQEELGIKGKTAKKSNRMLITEDCKRYFLLKKTNAPVSGEFKTKDDYIQYRYKEVEEWSKERTRPLITYTYLDFLRPTSQAKAFVIDVGFEVFHYIKEEMYGNLDGFLTSLPGEIFNNPYFGFRQESLNLEVKVKDDEVQVLDEYAYGTSIVQTIVKAYNIEDYIDMSPTDLAERISNDRRGYGLATNMKSLDTNDLALLSIVCSNMTANTLNEDNLEMSLADVCHQFYRKNTIRKREYLFVLKHIEKLANYTLLSERVNDGIYEKAILHFFDVHYQMPAEEKSGEINVDKEIAEVINQDDLTDDYELDISKSVIQFMIGKTIKDAWKGDLILKVYSKLYNQIESTESKVRAFLFILEGERLRIHPATSIECLPYSFFTSKLRFNNMKPNKIRAEIKNTLQFLFDQKVLIESFSVEQMGVNIKFYPFTPTEQMVYRIDTAKES